MTVPKGMALQDISTNCYPVKNYKIPLERMQNCRVTLTCGDKPVATMYHSGSSHRTAAEDGAIPPTDVG